MGHVGMWGGRGGGGKVMTTTMMMLLVAWRVVQLIMKSGACSEMLRAGTTLKHWHLNKGYNPGQGARIVSSFQMPVFQLLECNKTTNRGKAILLVLCSWLFPLFKHCKRFNKNTNIKSTRGRKCEGGRAVYLMQNNATKRFFLCCAPEKQKHSFRARADKQIADRQGVKHNMICQ